MIADFNTMPEMFSECNKLYFESSLPFPRFDLMSKTSILARFVYNPNKKGKHPIKWQKIKFSNCFDFPEDVFRNMMVHEMIHYYLAWNGIKDNRKHGKAFMKMAQELNEKYGLNVTVKIDASSFPKTENAPTHTGFFSRLFG